MTKYIEDIQQVERHGANHRSREWKGAQTPDVSNYLMNSLLQSTLQFVYKE